MACLGPNHDVMKFAIAPTEPEPSISLPNNAPSRNSGKNCARKPDALPMKVTVQCASNGSREKKAAIKAASGASSSTLQPRKASQIKRPSPIRMPRSPDAVIASALRQQHVDISGRALAEVVTVLGKKSIGAPAPLFLEQRDE